MLDGNVATAKSVLRDYINATIGFERLAAAAATPAKSLMQMFGGPREPDGGTSPRRHRLLQRETGVRLEVASTGDPRRSGRAFGAV